MVEELLPRYLFVYGTLMQGEVWHDHMQGAQFVREVDSLPCFELVDLGSHPAMVRGSCTPVRGELYRVNAEIIARLDQFEDHPMAFVRESIWIEEVGEVECYLARREQVTGMPRIRSGDWRRRRHRRQQERGE